MLIRFYYKCLRTLTETIFCCCFVFVFWLCLQHVQVSRPGIKLVPQLRQGHILNLLHHRGTSSLTILDKSQGLGPRSHQLFISSSRTFFLSVPDSFLHIPFSCMFSGLFNLHSPSLSFFF